jgi:hypothetical protein
VVLKALVAPADGPEQRTTIGLVNVPPGLVAHDDLRTGDIVHVARKGVVSSLIPVLITNVYEHAMLPHGAWPAACAALPHSLAPRIAQTHTPFAAMHLSSDEAQPQLVHPNDMFFRLRVFNVTWRFAGATDTPCYKALFAPVLNFVQVRAPGVCLARPTAAARMPAVHASAD